MTILVVDDNAENLYQLQILLGSNGYQVVTATNGAEALKEARQNPPDLIISDILMPVMDGFSLCREWKKDEGLRQIPFIFYTATYTDDRDRELALSLGARQFLIKPEEPDVFLRIICEVIQQAQRPPDVPARVPPEVLHQQDDGYLKQYNEALIRKLEAKMQQLERANRELQHSIDDRKRAEDALWIKNTSFDASIVAHSIANLDGVVTEVNDAFLRVWGYRRKHEVVGKPIAHFFNDPREVASIMPLLEKAGQWEGDFTAKRMDGTTFIAQAQATVVRDENGKVIAYQSALVDITAHRRAEEALRESERRYREFFTISRDCVFITTLDGKWIEFNDAALELFRCDSREALFQVSIPSLYVNPEERSALLAIIEKQGHVREYPIRLRRLDGTIIDTLITAGFQRNADGGGGKYYGTIRDITDRKRTEEALQKSEEQYRILVESAREAIYVVQKEVVQFANGMALRLTGRPENELVGHSMLDLAPPEDRAKVQAHHQRLLSGEITESQREYRLLGRDGAAIWLSVNAVRILWHGEPATLNLASDITKRKRALEALRQSEQQKTILNQIAHIFLTAPDHEIFAQVLSVVLQTMKSRFGIFGFIGPGGDLVVPSLTGEVWDQCKVPGKSVTFPKTTWGESLWGKALRESKTFCSDGPFHTPKGHIHIDHFLAVPIMCGNTSIGLLSVANAGRSYSKEDRELLKIIADSISPILNARLQRDVQEQKRQQAEEEIRKLNANLERRVYERTAELEAANKELESFSYSVSHDLRAPLRAINGYASMLLEDYEKKLDEEGRRKLGVVSAEAGRMGQLIDDLLAFSRLGRQGMRVAEVDMIGLARKVFDECAAQAPGRNIQLKLHSLPPVEGDSTFIREVWVNLIANAVKYTRPKPVARIEISGRANNDEVIYCVKDNGVGFDMKYVEKLFRVFQRLHRDEDFEGTGVGLALVQRIVQRHGGRVWAEATPNKGAAFYFALPRFPKASS